MPNPVPLSLYVHIPWCVRKCPYCDFNSHEKNAAFDENSYVDALLRDLEMEYERCRGRDLGSIFFGGGTPSLFSASAIERVIAGARRLFAFDDIEITLEANPGAFEQEKFTGFCQAGVNRLSIGVQSFNREHLKTLGRIHDEQQARQAVDTARAAGFDNINLDLMFALPGQDLVQALADIETACGFKVPHISFYQLTIEPNTVFHKHRPVLPDTDQSWEIQTQCQQRLQENGYHQYEISAYARHDKHCQHNLNYWRFGDYIGIGAGAHGKLSQPDENGALTIQRRWKARQPKQYMQMALRGDALSGRQQLESHDIVVEFLLNALRLKQGVSIDTFSSNTGLAPSELEQAVRNIDKELLLIDKDRIRTSERGYLFLNEILEQLI